jgi:dihydrofolate reductase
MKLTVTQFMTLDGVVDSPAGPDEAPNSGFESAGWLPPYFDEMVTVFVAGIFDLASAFLLGRRTYDEMSAFWPSQEPPEGRDRVELNELPKYVVTSRDGELTWAGSHRVTGDLATAVSALKSEPGEELQVHGSGTLVRSLAAARLVDTYRLLYFPVVLGRGRRLFEDAPPQGLKLTDSAMSDSGVAMLTYDVVGQPQLANETPPT